MAKPIRWMPLFFMLLCCSCIHSTGNYAPRVVLGEGQVISQICDSEERVVGDALARCSALDGPCQRARFDRARACCELVAMPPGMVCSEISERGGKGDLCDGFGGCRPKSEIPASPLVVGDRQWLEAFGGDGVEESAPVVWRRDDGSLEIRFGERPVARIPGSVEGRRVRVAADPILGSVALDLPFGPDDLDASLLLPRTNELDTEPFAICATSDSSGRATATTSGCPDGETVMCPSGGTQRIDCSLDEKGFAILSGSGLRAAWRPDLQRPLALSYPTASNPSGSAPNRLTRAGGRAGGGGGPIITEACRPLGATRACIYRRSCQGRQSCTPNGWGACRPSAEVCDGIDQDCDDVIDEGADWACDDGIPCTRDFCRSGSCQHDRGPFNLGQPGASCRSSARCAVAACAPDSLAVSDPRNSWTVPDTNGCRLELRATDCDRWDHCVCDGKELCQPFAAGAHPVTGCLSAPRGTFPGPLGHHRGCDVDENRCTQEHICCEISLACRLLPRDTTQEMLDQCRQSSFLAGFEDVVDGVAVRCLNQAPRVGFEACLDGNACTVDTCTDRVTGACAQTFISSGTIVAGGREPIEPEGTASCKDVINRGCGIQACDGFGRCEQVLALQASGISTAACSGQADYSCWDRACDGTGRCGAGTPRSERCRDVLGDLYGCPRRLACVVDSSTEGTSPGALPWGCTSRAGCIIDSRCVAEGALNPANECQVCRGWFEDGLAWAPQFPGFPCTPGPDLEGVCVAGGVCRPVT